MYLRWKSKGENTLATLFGKETNKNISLQVMVVSFIKFNYLFNVYFGNERIIFLGRITLERKANKTNKKTQKLFSKP